MKMNNRFLVKAQGNSMYPLLQDGDSIEYVQTPFGNVRLNDIVLMSMNKKLVTHRVIYKTKKTCITRGDNNLAADINRQKGRVLAKVVRFKRKGTWHGLQDVYFTQSVLYLNEIKQLKTRFNYKKISHIFLKGVLISLRYEGIIPKRIYADCDILVDRDDQKEIEESFKVLGYKLQEYPLLFTNKKNFKIPPEVSYIKIVSDVPVIFDVHFEPVFLMTQVGGMNLLYPPKLLKQLGDDILQRKMMARIKRNIYPICSVSDQIVYLTLHIFHHNYTDSIRYQLLDSVIRKSATTKVWSDVERTITTYHLQGYLYLVFILLGKYFKTPIPRSFIKVIQPSLFKKRIATYLFKKIDIFSQDTRTKAGIERFILILLLSPNPFWKKILLFIHPETIRINAKIVLSHIFRTQ